MGSTTIATPPRSVVLPAWMRRPAPACGRRDDVESMLRDQNLHTVCLEAKCPNRAECYGRGTATFLIMGDVCTRSCGFCGVKKGAVQSLDAGEPARVAEGVRRLRLRHVVITSVTRDDLPDGGASHIAATVAAVHEAAPEATTEVLVPDFCGNSASVLTVLRALPDVFNHNVETVPRLYPHVRPQADYRRSLEVVSLAARNGSEVTAKSGLMVGLGETEEEVVAVMRDLRAAGCSVLTIGQYLRPSSNQTPVRDFVTPEQFDRYREKGEGMGFAAVFSGPYVRSSYRADEVLPLMVPRGKGQCREITDRSH